MSLVSATIPNLVNGVSQQPYALRLSSQGEEQINGYSSIVEGLRKRPPLRHIARLTTATYSDCYVHTINRDTTERYVTILSNGALQVFGLDGVQRTVNFPNGTAYLATPTPSTSFSLVTVADYTFVLNKTVVVAAQATNVAANPNPFEALVWIRQSAYATTYKATLNGTTVSYKTADASTAANQADIVTDNIVSNIMSLFTTGAKVSGAIGTGSISGPTLGTAGGWVFQSLGSSLYVKNTTADFTISTSDGIGDTAIAPIKGKVQAFTSLPAKAINGMIIRIQGVSDATDNDYWVQYYADSGNVYGGQWRETVKPGETLSLDPATMPYVLIRNADDTFSFQRATWNARLVGDLTTNPLPSFVGRTLNDIFFYRNRLGVLADENVIMSRAGDFFNFFRQTAIQLLDDDMIDVATTNNKVSILRHAVAWNGSLMLMSDQTQFQIGVTDLLTPKTISILATTQYPCSQTAAPVGAGPNVYFTSDHGAYSIVREYYTDATTKTNDANNVTDHVPTYIPSNIIRLAASSNEGCLVALSSNNRQALYVYRYYWQQQSKLQSSWSRWDFPAGDAILNADFIVSDLYVVTQRSDGVYLEVASLEPGRADSPATFTVHLDRRCREVSCTVSYNATTGLTTITPPYPLDGQAYQLVAWYGDPYQDAGKVYQVATTAGQTSFAVAGRVSTFFFGRQYAFRYRMSKFLVREPAPGQYGTLQPVNEGRLQLRYGTLAYGLCGYFRVEVTPIARQTNTYVMSGITPGASTTIIGQPPGQQGTFRFPIMSENKTVVIDLVNDTYLPSAFVSGGWEGLFTLRSKRV